MKIRAITILIVATTFATGTVYLLRHAPSRPQVAEEAPLKQAQPDEPKVETVRSVEHVEGPTEPRPPPLSTRTVAVTQPPAVARQVQPKKAPDNQQRAAQYWEQLANSFNLRLEELSQEQDPVARMDLIRDLARYVRFDTPGTLEWAMGLEDPAEQRAALEAINKNALSGIGARIEIDETGFPKIRETTVLSAVAATGLVQPGDYIVGIEDGNGSTVFFDGMPVRQIVQHLRGQPGTEVNLIMERIPADGSGEPVSFDVPVQRSLIVVQPPF